MNDDWEKIWKGTGHDLVKALSPALSDRTEENHEKPQSE
jgi:hypothetical protein